MRSPLQWDSAETRPHCPAGLRNQQLLCCNPTPLAAVAEKTQLRKLPAGFLDGLRRLTPIVPPEDTQEPFKWTCGMLGAKAGPKSLPKPVDQFGVF
jgi:hypothetical protein